MDNTRKNGSVEGGSNAKRRNEKAALFAIKKKGDSKKSRRNFEDSSGFPFEITDKGVFFCPTRGDGKAPLPLFICSKLFVKACTRDAGSNNHGFLLEFLDADGVTHREVVPAEMLAGEGQELRKLLMNRGLRVSADRKARSLLNVYIQMANPQNRALCVSEPGWHNGVYVLPNEVFGDPGEEVVFQGDLSGFEGLKTAGTLNDWRTNVAALATENSRLQFATSSAFASILLELLLEESGGFHFRGASSTGKTTILLVSISAWGGPNRLHRWRATANGLEAQAASHNDATLYLDELGQISPKEAGDAAYLLANGSGKSRAARDGSARPKYVWRVIFVSTGELSLADIMRQVQQKARAGQEIRIVDIPADAGAGFGLFENLHGYKNGAEFSMALKAASAKYYGTAIREFLRILTSDRDAYIRRIEVLREKFQQHHVSSFSDGQVKRVGGRFSLVAAAGEIATEMGITGWEKGEATWAAVSCMDSWVESRGGVGAKEVDHALDQVRLFFEMHGESRFSLLGATPEAARTINRAGFKRMKDGALEFFVLPEVFKREVCADFDPIFVAKLLVEKGWIIPDASDKRASVHRGPDGKPIRVYRFINVLAE